MPSSTPKISIGLPVFNGEKYLRQTLTSLLSQELEDFELIVSDNASTDATASICQEFVARDSRVRYFRNAVNIGASPNYNRVFQLARGHFFKWASYDDLCHPALIRRCLDVFDSSPASTVLVFSRAEIIDENGAVVHESEDRISSSSTDPIRRFAKVLWSSGLAHSLWGVVRTDALRQTRLMGCIEADHVVLAELALLGTSVEIPEVLYWQRRHPGCAIPTHRGARELLAWHDPRRAQSRIWLPHWERVYIEYAKAVMRAPLSVWDCARGLVAIPAVSYGRRFLNWSGPFRHRFGLYRRSGPYVASRMKAAPNTIDHY